MRKFFIFLLFGLFLHANSLISYDKKLENDNGSKNVIFIFGTKTCGYCDLLKKDIDTNPTINALIKDKIKVYYISIDEGGEEYIMGDGKKTTNISLKLQFGTKQTPTVVLFDEKWKQVLTSPGYPPPPLFEVYLKYLLEDIHETKDLQSYLKEVGIL
jgi:thioredoxin-related protein